MQEEEEGFSVYEYHIVGSFWVGIHVNAIIIVACLSMGQVCLPHPFCHSEIAIIIPLKRTAFPKS